MTRHHGFEFIVLGLLTLTPQPTRASGSASVTVVARKHTLTIRQTFRRTLPAGRSGEYFAGVRERFLRIAADLTPRLDRLLAQHRERFDPALAEILCEQAKQGPLLPNKDAAHFPALVLLRGFHAKSNERLAYDVGLVFRRRPSAAHLAALQRRIGLLINRRAAAAEKREDGGAKPTAVAVRSETATVRSSLVKVVLRPSFWVISGAKARIDMRLKRLGAKLRDRAEAVLKRARGLTLAPLSDKLKDYGRNKALPSRGSVHLDSAYLHVNVTYGIKALANDNTLAGIRRSLYTALAQSLRIRD